MSNIVLFYWIECLGMKTSGNHRLIILLLSEVTAEPSITGICNKHHGVRIVVVDEFANRVILRQMLDVAECLIMLREPFEFGAFTSE